MQWTSLTSDKTAKESITKKRKLKKTPRMQYKEIKREVYEKVF